MLNKTLKVSMLAIAGLALWLTDLTPEMPILPTIAVPAEAVVGRPLTPVSAAGVARRTTRRAVYATSASSAQQQQQAQQPQAQQQAQQPQQAAAPASGSVMTALPEGCESMTIDGGSYFNCSGTIYKPTFQSGNLVYVVQ